MSELQPTVITDKPLAEIMAHAEDPSRTLAADARRLGLEEEIPEHVRNANEAGIIAGNEYVNSLEPDERPRLQEQLNAGAPIEVNSREVAYGQIDDLHDKRLELISWLVESGLITSEFVESGILDEFAIDESTDSDSLAHTLIGDEFGGAHHLPTLLGLGIENIRVASTIQNPLNPKKKLRDFRSEQKVRPNGVFRALHVSAMGEDGTESKKAGGSTFFPNEWSTQEVVAAIYTVSRMPGELSTTNDNNTVHESEHNGVIIKVVTSNITGKIISGYPK